MVVRPKQDARRRAKEKAKDPLAAFRLANEEALNLGASRRAEEKAQEPAAAALLALKSVLVTEAASRRLAEETADEVSVDQVDSKAADFKQGLEFVASLLPRLPPRGEALWDQAVESLGRSAGILEELAESTGEVIARIVARGDRIDRIQNETRKLLNALVVSEANS